jgi:hypothetical protein
VFRTKIQSQDSTLMTTSVIQSKNGIIRLPHSSRDLDILRESDPPGSEARDIDPWNLL